MCGAKAFSCFTCAVGRRPVRRARDAPIRFRQPWLGYAAVEWVPGASSGRIVSLLALRFSPVTGFMRLRA
jgi:hypothetical protein